jgi:hypothetical protein
MQDEYTGQAGTFINDPKTGTRIPLEKYQAAQAEEEKADADPDHKSTAKKAKTQEAE